MLPTASELNDVGYFDLLCTVSVCEQTSVLPET